MSSANFFLLQGILCFQACWHTAFSTQVPTLYSKSAFEMKALLTGMRLEGDQIVIFIKNGFWWESLRFLVYGGLCHAPLVFNWLRLAARMFPKVPEYSDSKSFSFIILSSTQQCAGHNRASCSKSDPRSNMFCTGKSDNSETDTEVKP